MSYFLGVDVGTGSVRVGLVDQEGNMLCSTVKNITVNSPGGGRYIQSSVEVWGAVCDSVREVMKITNIGSDDVKGIGFDATCSLVLVGEGGAQVYLDENGFDIMMWMDHRAEEEAEIINKTGNSVLDFVGGKVSLEMQLPKLLWLKRNNSDTTWKLTKKFFDLPDWLVFRSTDSESRSLCSLVCKWNYQVSRDGEVIGWDKEFFDSLGLGSLENNNWEAIGVDVQEPGTPVGNGVSLRAAKELGLLPGTPVATSMIDAHAGALGMLGAKSPGDQMTGRLGLVSGTSTCHMLLSSKPTFVTGVWGPFWSAVYPGMWLMEGGQSATGALIDHIIKSHPAYPDLQRLATEDGNIYSRLEDILNKMTKVKRLTSVDCLTQHIHIWPDYHGNRSPLADASLSGMMTGLTLSSDLDSLALYYLATLQAISYGTRHILDSLTDGGHQIDSVTVCGGLTTSPLYLQIQADVLGLPVVVPSERQSVLLGSAMLGMSASHLYQDLSAVLSAVSGDSNIIQPREYIRGYHQAKYEVFRQMVEDQKKYKKIMSI